MVENAMEMQRCGRQKMVVVRQEGAVLQHQKGREKKGTPKCQFTRRKGGGGISHMHKASNSANIPS
jgi:hypothetical protein